MKKCKICKCDFKPVNQNNIICKNKEHYFKCQDCGKLVKFSSYKELQKFGKISLEEMKIISNTDKKCIIEFPNKRCKICYKKFKQTDAFKKEKWQKHEKTYKKNHNGMSKKEFYQTREGKKIKDKIANASHTKEAEQKRQRTCLDRYGATNYGASQEYKEKVVPTLSSYHTEESKKKNRETLKKNHGVEYNYFMPGHAKKMIEASKTPEAKDKQKRTMKKLYGVESSYYLPGHAEKMIQAANAADKTQHKSKTNNKLANQLKEHGLYVEQEYKLSNTQNVDFLCCNPLDKQKKVLIDYNPTVTHNYDINFQQLTNMKWNGKPNRPKNYHIDRSKFAEEQNLELIQWFEHYDKDKMIDLIKAKCGITTNIIGARKCKIKKITGKEAKIFFTNNHLLNLWTKPIINYALTYNDNIISVMSFNKVRDNKTNKKLMQKDLTQSYELLRFATKKDWSITGGAQKLFKRFIKDYTPDYVLTYSDYNLGNGKIYKLLNFKEHGIPKPSCYWTAIHHPELFINNNLVLNGADKFLPRYIKNYFYVGRDKKDFIKRGGLKEYGKWPTNIEIMLHYKFVRIYDSGYKTWIWKAKKE